MAKSRLKLTWKGMDPQLRRIRLLHRKILIHRFRLAKRGLDKYGIPIPTR
jgi:hypothetical protein